MISELFLIQQKKKQSLRVEDSTITGIGIFVRLVVGTRGLLLYLSINLSEHLKILLWAITCLYKEDA
mgnify:CR=1 FL=1